MFRINQHIELLLLQHDCVVIPGFGGFVAHHLPAKISDEGRIMLPPSRTVGFNPQLTVNDSLLIQSYVDAYDISYPEALQILETEIEELRATLKGNGSFVFSSIGTLTCNSDDRIEFQPLESGLLSPSLYGLSDVSLAAGNCFATKNAKVVSIFENTSIDDSEVPDLEDDEVIRIKASTLKYIAAACVATLLLLSYPILRYTGGTETLSSVFGSFENNSKVDTTKKTRPVYHIYKYNKVKSETRKAKIAETKNNKPYTIVLAARISQHNAKAYVSELQQKGFKDVRITGKGKSRKVVFGTFETEEQARQVRNSQFKGEEFSGAWIYKDKV